MSSPAPQSPEQPAHAASRTSSKENEPSYPDDDGVEVGYLIAQLRRGLTQTMGLALLGLTAAVIVYLIGKPFSSNITSTRVAFAFKGFERGEYPDHSQFKTDDLRSPQIIAEAIRRQGLSNEVGFQNKIRGALSIEGIVPSNVAKDRDRLRASGQIPATYIPDEYLVTLSLPRDFPLTVQQRKAFLNEIVSVYRENFQSTYANPPIDFGNAFSALHNADFFEYELILGEEIQNITSYLNQQLDRSRTFRSPTTNLSFSDLIKQTHLYAQIRLNETLGLIHMNGLSRDRAMAMVKMDYYLRTLEDQESKAMAEEKVVNDLLAGTQERAQSYVLGIKSQATQARSEAPILDQGLIDSLLANDSYNFLVRKALDAGMKTKDIQAEKAQLLERRKNMESFAKGDPIDQSAMMARVQKSLVSLESDYDQLISNIRKTQADFAQQQFADVIRASSSINTDEAGQIISLVIPSAIGLFLGCTAGIGLSILNIFIIGAKRRGPHLS